jgi:predicted permease
MFEAPKWHFLVQKRLQKLGLRPEREADIVEEIAAQLEQAYQDALRDGAEPAEAVKRAEGHVKDWGALAAQLRTANQQDIAAPERATLGLWQDIRYTLRTLQANPGFALITILTLAFGIGGNTAIFTVVDHIALRGLPYPASENLVNIEHTKPDQPEVDPWCALANLQDFQRASRTFETIAGISPVWNLVHTSGSESERLEALFVSGEFFPMLGVNKPAAGRLFTDKDIQPVVVLSHAYWMRRFAGSPAVIGQAIRLDGRPATVIGVAPADFRWLGEPLLGTSIQPDIWIPLGQNPLVRSAPRSVRFLKVTGRLKPGVTFAQGREEVQRIGAALTKEHPDNRGLRFDATLLATRTHGPLRPAVYLLLGTVAFVLLMASANVANLLLARASAREAEIGVRVALGASWTRLFRQMLTESSVLAFLGASFGVALAYGLVRLIVVYGPPTLLRNAGETGAMIDLRALGFTLLVTVATALLAGWLPAWKTLQGSSVAANIRQGGRGITHGNRRLRSALSIAQVAIAVMLLIASGLLVRSILRVLSVDPGFQAANVVTVSTQVPPGSDPARRTAIYNSIRDRLLATPGVQSAGAVSRLPMLGQNITSLFVIEGQDQSAVEHPPEVEFRAATPSYFPTMGLPLRSGRLFEERDTAIAFEIIIDALTQQRYFPGVDPVGKRIRFLADREATWFTIIGVVGSVRHFGLEADPRPTIYRHTVTNPLSNPILVIRTTAVEEQAPAISTLARIVREASGSSLPTYNVFSMEQLIARSTSERRFLMWLISGFAIAALLLAAIGVYGAISQSVTQRTREIGVRMALGASSPGVIRMVLGEAMRVVGAGALLGLTAGWLAAEAGRKLLFQVTPRDPVVAVIAVGTVLLAGVVACYAPARRAASVDPMLALRQD